MLITRYQDAVQTYPGTYSLTRVLVSNLQIITGTTRHAYGLNSGIKVREVKLFSGWIYSPLHRRTYIPGDYKSSQEVVVGELTGSRGESTVITLLNGQGI